MAEVAFSPPGDADSSVDRSSTEIEYAAVEVAAELGLTRRASENQLNRAVSLTGRLRGVWDAFSAGDLDSPRVRVLDSQLVMSADPDGAASSFAEGVAERKIATTTNPDLTANLGIYSASPQRVGAARGNIEKLARRLKREGETRSWTSYGTTLRWTF